MRAALLLHFVLLPCLSARAAEPVLAVLPLGGDAAAATRSSIENRIRLAAGRYAAVQDGTATDQALKSARTLGLSCDTAEPTCAQQMGGLAGATRVLHGSLDGQGNLRLLLVEVRGPPVALQAHHELLPDGGIARDAAVERVVLLLLAPERVTARLHLKVAPRGASVVVDDIFRGPAPLATALVLPPGSHRIYVTQPGFLAEERIVKLEVGAAATVAIELERDPVVVQEPPQSMSDLGPSDAEQGQSEDGEGDGSLTVAVFPLASGGVPPRAAAALDEALAAELARREGLVVVGPREVANTLAAAPTDCVRSDACLADVARVLAAAPTDCVRRDPCLADVARVLGADAFVVSRAEVHGHVTTLRARRHDTESGEPLAAGTLSSLADNRRRLLFGMPALAEQLFPDRAVALGTPPVDLDYYAERMSGAPLAPWLFWTAAGVGGALAVATAAAGAFALSASEPADAGRAGAAFAVGAGGTVVALGAAGVIGVLVDWEAR